MGSRPSPQVRVEVEGRPRNVPRTSHDCFRNVNSAEPYRGAAEPSYGGNGVIAWFPVLPSPPASGTSRAANPFVSALQSRYKRTGICGRHAA